MSLHKTIRNYLYAFLLIVFISFTQETKQFKILKLIQTSPLKNQQSSGTYWSFATTSFIETKVIRLGKDTVILTPIFYVTPFYLKKATIFIEKKGKSWFGAGDLTFSVLDAYKEYGAIPEVVYNSIIEGDWQHNHVEKDNLLLEMVTSIGTSGYGRIKPNSWKKSIKEVLNSYLGEAPKTFLYKGAQYTPKTFADTFVGINPEDYIEITSYTHHHFYEKFVLDIPANWNKNNYLNLPINDFEEVINNALSNGFTLAWDGEASETTFNFEKGVLKLTKELEKTIISQKLRQASFEDKTTTEDHNMHIVGIANDNNGKIYYILKNSEGKK